MCKKESSPNMIFVFGSNLAGRHGKGAAKFAAENYGAEYGVGEGVTGLAYAIPTKGRNLEVLSLDDIAASVASFIDHAKGTPNVNYLLTPIGTGLAGHSKRDIWSILKRVGVPDNVILSNSWVND